MRRCYPCIRDHLVIPFDKGDIGNWFRQLVDGVVFVAELLEVVLIKHVLIPRDSEYDLIDDVGGVLWQNLDKR